MTAPDEAGLAQPSRQVRAEAASWVARLHGPHRDADLESGLKRWLAEDPAHRVAFELATDVWQETSDLPCDLPPLPQRRAAAVRRHSDGLRILAYASLFALMLMAALYYGHFRNLNRLTTGIGEQRSVTLTDGTRVEINTRSELRVSYDERTRKIVLESGEAYFDVAKQPDRPFVVMAGRREIVALGTEFFVRRDGDAVAVTLLEGRVAVTPEALTGGARKNAQAATRVLQPGERMQIAAGESVLVDQPSLEKATAWQHGQLIFEDTKLAEAVEEFNRYSHSAIEIGSPELGEIRVGGTFRFGDIASFARAVASSHGLEVVDRGGHLLLARVAAPSGKDARQEQVR